MIDLVKAQVEQIFAPHIYGYLKKLRQKIY